MKLSKRYSKFVEKFIEDLQTVPKMRCNVLDVLSSSDDSLGEHFVEYSSGKHAMYIRLSEFKTFHTCICVITHECIHAALSDIFMTFDYQKLLREELIALINERAAHVADQFITHVLKNMSQIRKKYADLESNKIKPKTFLNYVTTPIRNIPKSDFSVRETLSSENVLSTEHMANYYTGEHIISFREDAFDSFDNCIASLAHESLVASLFDIIISLEFAGLLTQDMAELLRERPAQVLTEITLNLITNYTQIKSDFDCLKEKEDEKDCSIRTQEKNGEGHSSERTDD